jgi:hypothetical protein
VTYQKPNEKIDLLMVADPSTDVIIEEDEWNAKEIRCFCSIH